MKKNYCNHLNKDVAIDTCWTCRFLCVDNPNLKQSGHWNSEFVNLWGVDEIEQYIESRRIAELVER